MVTRWQLKAAGTERLLGRGLTQGQIYWINHHFQLIVEDLRPPAGHADIRTELAKVARHLVELDGWCAQASKSTLRQAPKVALGHIGLVAAEWRKTEAAGNEADAIPDRMDIHVLVRSLREIVEKAKTHFPAKSKQPRHSGVRAVEWIEEAINRPDDEASLKAAKSFKLSLAPGSAFLEVAEIIFEEAAGEAAPSAAYAIRELKAERAMKKTPCIGG